MKLLSTLLVFAGYTLIYSAVANKGRYAQNPWMSVFRDAYGVAERKKGGGNSQTPAPAAPPNKRASKATKPGP